MEENLEKSLSNTAFWHERYTQQTAWTEESRRYLFTQADVKTSDSLLEVGCGTAALLNALMDDRFTHLIGIDIDLTALSHISPYKQVACADGLTLPFPDNTFQHSLCHFTLMWVNNPKQMLHEMVRVTAPGGWVFALAESDYSHRISYPLELMRIADLQTASLEKQGANTRMGHLIASLFKKCRLTRVIKGALSYEITENGQNALSGDLKVLRNDLVQIIPQAQIKPLITEAAIASKEKGAKWHVPVHYACGQVQK